MSRSAIIASSAATPPPTIVTLGRSLLITRRLALGRPGHLGSAPQPCP
jgi:hypothetical protein